MTWGAVFPLAAGIGFIGEGWVQAGLFGAGFLFGGLMFGPDLDLPSVQVRRWGILRGIWLPYQRMFRHRSRWTHGLFLGPLVRILYLGAWVATALGAAWAVAVGVGAEARFERWPDLTRAMLGADPSAAGYVLVGIWGGSALHSVSDAIVSRAKRLLRFGKRRR